MGQSTVVEGAPSVLKVVEGLREPVEELRLKATGALICYQILTVLQTCRWQQAWGPVLEWTQRALLWSLCSHSSPAPVAS